MTATAILITLGSFIAAYINAVFATGGFFVMLAFGTTALPLTIAIPLQPAFIYTSLMARVAYFWKELDRKIVLSFSIGAVVGVFLGARIFITLPEWIISIGIGTMMLLITWMPAVKFRPRFKYPYLPIGFLHAFLTTVFGASGLLQTIMVRTSLLKLEITSTLAACFIVLETMRSIGYAAQGFNYTGHLALIALASLAGIAGTWAGKGAEHLISDQAFRTVFKWLMTLVALRLLYKAWVLI